MRIKKKLTFCYASHLTTIIRAGCVSPRLFDFFVSTGPCELNVGTVIVLYLRIDAFSLFQLC